MLNLDTDILRSFVAVADAGGFTAGGERVARSQSAISIQIRKLEERLGKRLFERTPRRLSLTRDGEALLGYARRLLELNDEAVAVVSRPPLTGTLRLGVTEYFVPRHLPAILARFAAMHPNVALTVEAGISATLRQRLDDGGLDLAVVRQGPNDAPGEVLLHEPLLWVAGEGFRPDPGGPVKLVALAPPCGMRALAVSALQRAGRQVVPVFTSGSLLGLLAAVEAGLGVAVLGYESLRPGLRVLGRREGLPDLGHSTIALVAGGRARTLPGVAMGDALRDSLRQLQR